MSFVVNRVLDETTLDKSDKASIRRWKSRDMKPGSDEMKALHEKLNADIARLWDMRRKSEIRRPDWR